MPQDHVRSDLMKQFYLFVQTCRVYLWTHKSFYKSSFVCSIRNWWNMSIIKCVIIVVFMASAWIKFMPVKLGDSKFCIKHKIATIGVHLSITPQIMIFRITPINLNIFIFCRCSTFITDWSVKVIIFQSNTKCYDILIDTLTWCLHGKLQEQISKII